MSETTIACDQAIFTSVRTPMGEGYRIVAASRGLRPEEKQTITRFSPSHEALCSLGTDAAFEANLRGAAFYPLPTTRLCVACSCDAGAEHTGRGGMRVYTHNVVFDRSDLPQCGYNPFVVLRAMIQERLTSPQLKPPPVLPALQLSVPDPGTAAADLTWSADLTPAWRAYVLQSLLTDRNLILNIKDRWLEVAEAFLMGLPGPARADVSFAAGLRFSIGRCHHLSLLYDDHDQIRARIAGQGVKYLDPATADEPPPVTSAWLSFVQRHWSSGDIATLTRRTSRAFTDVGEAGRERIGRLYNSIDEIPQAETPKLLGEAVRHLNEPERGVEADIAAELIVASQRELFERLWAMSWDDASRYWPTLTQIRRQSEEGCLFADPLVKQALTAAGRVHPMVAAEAALELGQHVPAAAAGPDHDACLNDVLTRLADWAQQAPDEQLEGLPRLTRQWRMVRPQCAILDRIDRRCSAATTGPPPAR
jgi:hypothetical protein